MFCSISGRTVSKGLASEAEQELGGRADGGEELHGQEDGRENRVLVQQGKASTLRESQYAGPRSLLFSECTGR